LGSAISWLGYGPLLFWDICCLFCIYSTYGVLFRSAFSPISQRSSFRP